MALSVQKMRDMSFVRICLSIPAVLVACAVGSAALGGCYDLSSSGPRPEDFAAAPTANGTQAIAHDEAPAANPTAFDTSDDVVHAFAAPPAPSARENEANDPGAAFQR